MQTILSPVKKTWITFLYVLLVSLPVLAQNGMYLEYTMTLKQTYPDQSSQGSLFKTYLLPNVGSRTEMETKIPQLGQSMKSVFIYRFDKPSITILLNEANKTYTERGKLNKPTKTEEAYQVKVIGKEKVSTYNCTHSQVSRNNKVVYDLWTTRDIPGYEKMAKMMTTSDTEDYPKVMEALQKQQADGFTIKMSSPSMTMQLSRHESKPLVASLFSVPAGYTQLESQEFIKQQMQVQMQGLRRK